MIKAFLKSLGIVFALILFGNVVAATIPSIGIFLGLAFLVVPAIAIFKPLPKLYLGHRGFSFSIAFFAGLATILISLGGYAENERTAELRASDPAAYLSALELRDKKKWLAELQELAPERYATETAKLAAAEAAKIAEQESAIAKAKSEAAADEEAKQLAKVAVYTEQLEREIASIPKASASDYAHSVRSINLGLVMLSAWAQIYEEGESLNLTQEARERRQRFRRLLVEKQVQLLPAFRDAYGPAMSKDLWEADGSARTLGQGYRTIELVSVAFARNANISQVHNQIQESLMMLRFTRAQYKWIKSASEFSYYKLNVPKDTQLVKWTTGGNFQVLE